MPENLKTHFALVSTIIVKRESRLRSSLDEEQVRSIVASLQDKGRLFHPVGITAEGVLVWGEHRLEAHKRLGWEDIWATVVDEKDPDKLRQIELEENICRVEMSWQDHHRAVAELYARSGLSQEELGKQIGGLTKGRVNQILKTAKYLDHPEVAKCDNATTAFHRAETIEARQASAPSIIVPLDEASPVKCADFNEWARRYEGPLFNFLHIDFPYGINAHKSEGQNSALSVTYPDTWENAERLIQSLIDHQDRLIAPSAHLVFWFSPSHQRRVWELLQRLRGFIFEEHPLVWARGEPPTEGQEYAAPVQGLLPDPQRRPRRVYESALFGFRGDAKVLKVRSNFILASVKRDQHEHEKSEVALKYYFEMVVDEHTIMLDPTCGSGSALAVAQDLGAAHVVGLELNPEHAAKAAQRLRDNVSCEGAVNGTALSANGAKPTPDLKELGF